MYRSNFRRPLPLMKFRFCYRAEVAPELVPVLPVNRKYRSFYRKFRPRGFYLLVLGKLFWVGRYYRSRGFSFLAVGEFSLLLAASRLFWVGAEVPALRVFLQSAVGGKFCVGR